MRRIAPIMLVLAMAACSSGNDATPNSAASTPERTTIAGVSTVVRGRLTVTGTTPSITIEDNYFEPNLLTAGPGATLTFTLKNEGGALHNFSITEQTITKDVPSGTSLSVPVTVPASGRLVFFCKYHRDDSGMIGAIDVS
jgi:plastocyanin